MHGNPDNLPISNKWDLSIPTFVRSFDGELIRLQKINDVVYSGKQKVFKLILNDGKSIKATKEHKFLTKEGWKELQTLTTSDYIMLDTLNPKKLDSIKHKWHDIQIGGLVYHPHAKSFKNKKALRVKVQKLCYESYLNNLEFTEFIGILKNDEKKSSALKFTDEKMHIHHKDGNHYNNAKENLVLLTPEEHLKLHGEYLFRNFNQGVPVFAQVNSITPIEEMEETYDIVCDEPNHNFVANGMIIHNSGKSTWAFQQAGAIDNEMFKTPENFVKRICFTPEEFFDNIRNVKNGVIIFDEAFRGFASRSALSKINKKLVQGLMEMGQNNNIVFIVLPRIFLLDIYPAMLRSNGLFNIYFDKRNNKRCWRGFNYKDKNKIYQDGTKKGWRYAIRSNFRGNFYSKFPGGKAFEEAYLKKKATALHEMDSDVLKTSEREKSWMIQRDLLICNKYYELKSARKVQALAKELGFALQFKDVTVIYEKMKPYLPSYMVIERRPPGLRGKVVELLDN
jgi:hypothetical protein